MGYSYRFPHGRFTYDEWLAAYRLLHDDEAEAKRWASIQASVSPDDGADVGEGDLAALALVSEDLSKRVEQFRREVLANPAPHAESLHAALEARWEPVLAGLRKKVK